MIRTSRMIQTVCVFLCAGVASGFSLSGGPSLPTRRRIHSGRLQNSKDHVVLRRVSNGPAPERGLSLFGSSNKKRLIDAVDELGGRVTAADVAGAGASDIYSAERELVALAARFGPAAALEATSQGDLIFDFGKTPSKTLAKVDSREKWAKRWRTWRPGVEKAGRFSFGLCLFASLAVVSVALLVTSTAASDNSDDRRGGGASINIMPSPFTYWDFVMYDSARQQQKYYEDEERRRRGLPPKINFMEAVFSYVFGEGDPNAMKRTLELERAANIIRANDGVVVAEQLAPVIADGPPDPASSLDADSRGILVDESWVLPIVSALGGRAEVVGQEGTIVYVFDDLVDAAYASSSSSSSSKPSSSLRGAPSSSSKPRWLGPDDLDLAIEEDAGVLQESRVKFSKAENDQLVAAGALGALNLVAVTALVAKIVAQPVLLKVFPALRVLLVPLVAYGVAFNLVPALRSRRVDPANDAIDERNAKRRAWAQKNRKPDAGLRSKLRAAKTAAGDVLLRRRRRRTQGRQNTLDDDVVFSSDEAQADANLARKTQMDLDDFDKRLAEAMREKQLNRDGGGGGGGAAR